MEKAAEETIEQDCAMRHIIIFQKQALERRQADLAEPCQTCKHASECKYDWFRKISNALPKATEKITLIHRERQKTRRNRTYRQNHTFYGGDTNG